MPTFRNARDLPLLTFCEDSITEDEFLLLYDVNTSKNPEYPYWDYKKFYLQDKDLAECKTEFRFQTNDIPLLLNVLGLPEKNHMQTWDSLRRHRSIMHVAKATCLPMSIQRFDEHFR